MILYSYGLLSFVFLYSIYTLTIIPGPYSRRYLEYELVFFKLILLPVAVTIFSIRIYRLIALYYFAEVRINVITRYVLIVGDTESSVKL